MRISTSLPVLLPRLVLLSALGLAAFTSRAQVAAPTWASVQRSTAANSTSAALARKVVVAPDGSQYVAGPFVGTVTIGGSSITQAPTDGNLLLARYNANGSLAWVRAVSEVSGEIDAALAVDAAGNLYVGGFFGDAISFGSLSLTSAPGAIDAFVAKLDPQGQPLWARAGGVTNGDAYGAGVGVDASGNVYLSGDFGGTLAFGGGSATQVSATTSDVFIVKFTSAGTPTWVRSGGSASNDFNYDLVTDAAGNSYLTGSLRGTANFGAVALSSTTTDSDIYVVKYDANGTPQWAQRTGTTGNDSGSSLATDAAGAVAVTGFSNLTQSGNDYYSNTFLARFAPNGAPLWTRQITPTVNDEYSGAGVAFDNRGGLYLVGSFAGSVVFGNTTLSSAAPTPFIVRYDSQGNAVWATNPASPSSSDQVAFFDVSTDTNGNAFVAGAALGTVNFGSVSSAGSGVGLILAKLNAGGTINASRAAEATALAVFPNPATEQATLMLPAGGGRLVLTDALGRTVREQALPAVAGRCTVSVAGLAPGLYQLRATLGNGESARAALTVR